jgi:hypothetical protein
MRRYGTHLYIRCGLSTECYDTRRLASDEHGATRDSDRKHLVPPPLIDLRVVGLGIVRFIEADSATKVTNGEKVGNHRTSIDDTVGQLEFPGESFACFVIAPCTHTEADGEDR